MSNTVFVSLNKLSNTVRQCELVGFARRRFESCNSRTHPFSVAYKWTGRRSTRTGRGTRCTPATRGGSTRFPSRTVRLPRRWSGKWGSRRSCSGTPPSTSCPRDCEAARGQKQNIQWWIQRAYSRVLLFRSKTRLTGIFSCLVRRSDISKNERFHFFFNFRFVLSCHFKKSRIGVL